jgi:hypothetical protein
LMSRSRPIRCFSAGSSANQGILMPRYPPIRFLGWEFDQSGFLGSELGQSGFFGLRVRPIR